jgi:hypothetical protein
VLFGPPKYVMMVVRRLLLFLAVGLCTLHLTLQKGSSRCNGPRRMIHLRSGRVDPCSTAAAR